MTGRVLRPWYGDPMTFAIDLRSMGALVLVTLIAGCNNALTPDDPAPRSTTSAMRSQPSPSSSSSSVPSTRPVPSSAAPLPNPAPQTDPQPLSTSIQSQLADAIRLFDAGEFYLAAGRLRNLPDLNSANVETQLMAMKYLAFSYCVTNRRTLCQQQFEAALRVDPKFELAPAERGHPIWKVHFERAKSAMVAAPAPKGSDAVTGKSGGDRKSSAKKAAAKASDARTGDANTSDPKIPKSASKRGKKGAKDEPTAPATTMFERSSPDQKPQ